IRPGPFTRQNLPSWKTTPRSYSRRIFSVLNSTSTMIASSTNSGSSSPNMVTPFRCELVERFDVQQQTIDGGDAQPLPFRHRARAARTPALTVCPNVAFDVEILERGRGPLEHVLHAADDRTHARLHREPDDREQRQRARGRNGQ